MRRGKRVKVVEQPLEDPERIIYVVPQNEPGIPVEMPDIRVPVELPQKGVMHDKTTHQVR